MEKNSKTVTLWPSGALGLQSSEAPSSGTLKRQLCGRERKREEQVREGEKGRRIKERSQKPRGGEKRGEGRVGR